MSLHADDDRPFDAEILDEYARMMQRAELDGSGIAPMFVRHEYLTPDEEAARDAADDAEGLAWLNAQTDAENARRGL